MMSQCGLQYRVCSAHDQYCDYRRQTGNLVRDNRDHIESQVHGDAATKSKGWNVYKICL